MILEKLESVATPFAVSLAQVKAHLRILTNDEDTYLTSLISVASEVCESQSRRQLFTAQYRLTISSDFYPFRALNTREIFLTPGPVQQVDSITVRGQAVDVDTWRVRNRDPYTLVPQWGDMCVGDVVITFTTGYGDEPEDIPAALVQFMLLLIGSLYFNRESDLDVRRVVENPSYAAVLGTQRDVRVY